MKSPVEEYIHALLASERLGRQVAHHRVISGSDASFAQPVRPFSKGVQHVLEAKGLTELYAHQAHAINCVRAGRHVVVATPTASGKTLTYNLPVLEQMLADPDAKALYMFPLKALAQDQLRAFGELAALTPVENQPTAAIYDGDTTPYRRQKIRNNPPNVILTNPEMVHLSILPHHESWAQLLAGLTHIVVDEVHTYRGVMGSHMSCVFRRLIRMCEYYGSRPSFVFCSATVGNPAELCTMLTGLEVEEVSKTGAAKAGQHVVFLNPLEGTAQAVIQLLQAALSRGLRTIVYTQSRKLTELLSLWASERSGQYKDRISAYRAGFLPEERREIEARMSSGELLAVISTSALELGIDIGGLDLCILAGYPGTVMATLQRGGRVGRAQNDSGVVLVAQEDALDQYFMRHPEDFFSRPAESAVLNPENPVILDRHILCAAAELSLRKGEPFIDSEGAKRSMNRLLGEGVLLQSADGLEYFARRKRPHREVDLRGAGKTMVIEVAGSGDKDGEVVGTVDEHRAYKETHPGAVYLHRGTSMVVDELDLESKTVRVSRKRVAYYTRTRGQKSTEILQIYDRRTVGGTRMFLGKLKVTEQITGYEKRAVRGGKLLGVHPLELPPLVFETEGLWFEIPDEARRAAEADYLHFMGGIHAMEHAAIGILPLMVMTDRNDLGGISTPFHPQVAGPAVFVYDAMPGGAGLTRQAFARGDELFETTLKAVAECECDLGCPSCVHSPKCGSGNRPIDKACAIFLLKTIIERGCSPRTDEPDVAPLLAASEDKEETMDQPKRFGVLDIETRRSAQEVGGWNRADKMGVSIAVLYDSELDEFLEFEEHQMDELQEALKVLDLVIGFNILRFDYKVLSGLSSYPFSALPTLDLLLHVHNRLGYRLKLDSLAQATLDVGKSADGLQALKWWQEGRLDLITEYCKQDVAVTRDLYLFGKENGYVMFVNKAGQKVRLPVEW